MGMRKRVFVWGWCQALRFFWNFAIFRNWKSLDRKFPSWIGINFINWRHGNFISRPGHRHSSGSLWSRGPKNLENLSLPEEKKHSRWRVKCLLKNILVICWHILVKSHRLTHDLINITWVLWSLVRLFQCDQLPSSTLRQMTCPSCFKSGILHRIFLLESGGINWTARVLKN